MATKLAKIGVGAAALGLLAWCSLDERSGGPAPTRSTGPSPPGSIGHAPTGRTPEQWAAEAVAAATSDLRPSRRAVPTRARRAPSADPTGLTPLPGHDRPQDLADAAMSTPAPVASAAGPRAGPPRLPAPRAPHGELIASAPRDASLVAKEGPAATEIAAVGSQVRVSSHRHLVAFDAQGFTFTPKDAQGAPHDEAALRYALEEVTRGDAPVALAPASAPKVDRNQVRYERAPSVAETYLAFDDGIEQLFSFTELPAGEGDLVIRGRVETALQGAPAPGGGVRFRGDDGATVSFGKARACDGLGRVVDVDLLLAGDALELRVPGEWLAGAQAPLLVDPLVDSEQQLTPFGGDDTSPDLAYDAAHDEFVLAFVNGGTILAASRLDGAGRLIQSGVILDNSGASKSAVSICASEAGIDHYLIVYQSAYEVWAVVVDRELAFGVDKGVGQGIGKETGRPCRQRAARRVRGRGFTTLGRQDHKRPGEEDEPNRRAPWRRPVDT